MILPMLHTRLHLNVLLLAERAGRSLGVFLKNNAFSNPSEHWKQKFCPWMDGWME
jgi:hypothetical protein